MNTWPDGKRRALTQSQHAEWNASNYPGTLELCSECDEPTGYCEEDGRDGAEGARYCDECIKPLGYCDGCGLYFDLSASKDHGECAGDKFIYSEDRQGHDEPMKVFELAT